MPIAFQHQIPTPPNPWARPDPYLYLVLLGGEVAIAYRSGHPVVQAVCAVTMGALLLLAMLRR